MPKWPWNETREQRRTRIAHLYRDALWEAAPHACYDLDATMDDYGQHWITGNYPPINTDEPMTVKQIADWTDVRIQAVYNRITALGIRPAGMNRKYRKTYKLADFLPKPNHTGVICTASQPTPKTGGLPGPTTTINAAPSWNSSPVPPAPTGHPNA